MASFKESLEWLSLKKKSRVILALDTLGAKARFGETEVAGLLEEVGDFVVGVKLGLPFYVNLCQNTKQIVERFPDMVFIADWKTADVPHVAALIFEHIFDLGFGAGIIHAFTGIGPMSEAVKVARSRGGEVIAVVAMSHSDAGLINSHAEELAEMAAKAGVDCYVAPSTSPQIIRSLKQSHPKAKIFSPGIGAQGGEAKQALRMGADYLIVGRLITDSPRPAEAARSLAEESWTWT